MRILHKIKTEFDYQSYVEANHAVRYAGNGELRINCPKCGDNKFKCYVNNTKKYFNCFKCEFSTGKYDVFDFVALSEGITRGKAMLRLSREFAELTPDWTEVESFWVDEDEAVRPSEIKTIPGLPAACKALTDPSVAEEAPFWDYLLGRGLTQAEILAIKTHYVPHRVLALFDENKKRRGDIGRRIFIPIYGPTGKMVSWLARTIQDKVEPKYFNCPDSEASRVLWPNVSPHGTKVVLVEGVLDALAVRRLEGVSAYATLGKKISLDQRDRLKSWGVTDVVLFWDKKDAIEDMVRAVSDLKMHFRVFVADLRNWPAELDAGDCLRGGKHTLLKPVIDAAIDVESFEYVELQLG